MTEAYIYALVDPRTQLIRYVGKTNNLATRLRRHRTENGRSLRHCWLGELRELGLQPRLLVLQLVSGDWQAAEKKWIARLRAEGHDLFNVNKGGTGASGSAPTEETRARISEGVRKAWQKHPRKLSKEHRDKFCYSRLGAKQTEQTRRKIGNGNRGKKRSEETRKRISAARRGKGCGKRSPEMKAKCREQKLGSLNPMAKLNEAAVQEIRQRYIPGIVSLSMLAEEYGVDTRQIHRVVRGESWAHV